MPALRPKEASFDGAGPHEVKASDTTLRARRGGTASLVLKAFLITGTVGLLVWAGILPNDDSEPPVAWAVLLFALPAAALVLLVLRLLRRTQPLMPYVARGVRMASPVYAFGAAVVATGLFVAVALAVLMGLGLVVRGVSTAVGAPLPYVQDDPNRIEWGGVGELVGYGLAAALTLCVLYAYAQRALPARGRGYLDRVIGSAVLLILAVSGAWVAIDNRDPFAAIFGLTCGYGAILVMRGLPLDDEHDREVGGSGVLRSESRQ